MKIFYKLYASSGSYNIVQNANATGTNSVPLGRWTHYALVRQSEILGNIHKW